jgi:hypothetical protein
LPTSDQALDQLGADENAQPLHVVRFGPQLRPDGVLGNSKDAGRCIGYLTKYLTKDLEVVFAAHVDSGTEWCTSRAGPSAERRTAGRRSPAWKTCSASQW